MYYLLIKNSIPLYKWQFKISVKYGSSIVSRPFRICQEREGGVVLKFYAGPRASSPSQRALTEGRFCVRCMRCPRQAIRRRQYAPFSARLLYVFPPLLRILCRDKFFLRRIKILEEHSEYLARPSSDIDVRTVNKT